MEEPIESYGFTSISGIHYDKLKVISFRSNNFGTLLSQSNERNIKSGVYLFKKDDYTAYRIYRRFPELKFNGFDDDKVVSHCDEIRDKISLTNLPTGIVTYNDRLVGQEVPYYYRSITLDDYFSLYKIDNPYTIYIKINEILKELYNNGFIYLDNHGKNVMIDLVNKTIQLIDFESRFIMRTDRECILMTYILDNLRKMAMKLNTIINVDIEGLSSINISSFESVNHDLKVLERIHNIKRI